MATHSQGIVIKWDGTAFQEVSDLSWSYGGALPKGRLSKWTDDLGSVSITCLGTVHMQVSQYGERKNVEITGGGANLTHKAVFESIAVAPELNGVTRYTVTLKLVDE